MTLVREPLPYIIKRLYLQPISKNKQTNNSSWNCIFACI